MSIVDSLKQAYEVVDREQLLERLDPRRRYRDRIHVRCPNCGDDRKDAYIFDGSDWIICPHTNKCGEKISLLEYHSGKRGLSGEAFVEAAKAFCKFAGVNVEEKSNPNMIAAKAKREALEQILQVCQDLLVAQPVGAFDPPCAGLEYLEKRGFSEDDCKTFGFGFLDSAATLAGVASPEELQRLGFYFQKESGERVASKRWSRRAVIPIRDRTGKLVGLCGRAIDVGADPKYLYTTDCKLSDLGAVGIDGYDANRGPVVLVEGLLDAYTCKRAGMWGSAIGASGTALSAQRWDFLWRVGVRVVVLALDNDDAGRKGLLAACRSYDLAGNSPAVVVVDPALFDDCKDPDEYITRYGVDGFQRLVRGAVHIDRWVALEVAKGFDLSADAGRSAYLRECEEVAAGSSLPRRIQARAEYFWTTVAEALGLPIEQLQDLRHLALVEKQEKKRVDALRNLPQFDSETPSSEIAEALINHVRNVETKIKSVYVSQMLPSHVQLFADREVRKQLSSGDYVGIPNRSLPTLDRYLLGLRGAIVLAGATNTGKTILLCQLACAVLENNPEACVLFLTIEMTAFQIRTRILSHLAQLSQEEILRAERGESDASVLNRIREAERVFESLLNRLHVWHPSPEQSFDSDTVLEEVAYLKSTSQCSRCAVFVDYLDVWEPPPESDRWTDSKIEKWQMRQILNIRDANGIENPVIAVSEIRKSGRGQEANELTPDDVMGSARKIYGADFIVLWDKMGDRSLTRWFEWTEHEPNKYRFNLLSEPAPPLDEKEFKKIETKLVLEQLRAMLARQRIGIGFMNIVKIRDGGTKGVINVTTRWDHNLIREGINVDAY